MKNTKTLPALLAVATLAAVAAPTTASAQSLADDDVSTVVDPPTCTCPASAYAYAPAYGYAAYEEPGYAPPAYGYAAPVYGYAPPAYEEPVYAAPADEQPDYAVYSYGRRVFAQVPSAYANARRGFASARPSSGPRPAVAASLPRGSSTGLRPTTASIPHARSPKLRPAVAAPLPRGASPGLRPAAALIPRGASPGLRPTAALIPRDASSGLRPTVAASLPREQSSGLRPAVTRLGARANNTRSGRSPGVPVASRTGNKGDTRRTTQAGIPRTASF
jgi:hypothetical protein